MDTITVFDLPLPFSLVLLQWCIQFFKVLQLQCQPCSTDNWLWHIQWQRLLAAQKQVNALVAIVRLHTQLVQTAQAGDIGLIPSDGPPDSFSPVI